MNYAHTARLDTIIVQIWIDLAHGALRSAHPYHTPALATIGSDGPEQRTVVLRDADADRRRLLCHTDLRSPKVAQLQSNAAVSWLFYDRANKTQLRIGGEARVHHDDEFAQARWERSAPRSRACYHAAEAPSSPTAAPGTGAPLDSGFQNFAVVDCRVRVIDWLHLQHDGHLRARFDVSGDAWRSHWIAP